MISKTLVYADAQPSQSLLLVSESESEPQAVRARAVVAARVSASAR